MEDNAIQYMYAIYYYAQRYCIQKRIIGNTVMYVTTVH